ncbi:MAG: hypothetical protein ABSG04_02385 [Verrucomicrobiota bacterium]|jgi:Spy/CpxP family protein refolding chaperone
MVIFVCGVITGALVIETQRVRRPPSGPGGPSYGLPGARPVNDILHQMAQAQINLTSEQTNKIVKIVQDSQATNAAIRKTIAPLLTAEVERAYDAISQLLTSDQQKKFAELRKEREQRNEGLGPGFGPGRGRRGGEGGGNWSRNPNRGGSNDFMEELRGRMEGLRGRMDATAATNVRLTNAPPTNAP